MGPSCLVSSSDILFSQLSAGRVKSGALSPTSTAMSASSIEPYDRKTFYPRSQTAGKMPGRHTQQEETTRRLELPRLRRTARLSALRLEAVRASPGHRHG